MFTGSSSTARQKKIFARKVVAVLVFQGMKMEDCSRVTHTHNPLAKTISEFAEYTNKNIA
jgi:hypothetical protein